MKLILILSVFLFVFISCDEGKINNDFIPKTIIPALIAHGELYGNGREGIVKQNLVIKTQEEWNNLIAAMNSVNNVSDNFAETYIDFSKYQVIAVFDEVKIHSGWDIDFTDITENANEIVVTVSNPNTGGEVRHITQPFQIVKISVSSKSITFNDLTLSHKIGNIGGLWKVKALSISGELTNIDSPPDDAIYSNISIQILDATQGNIRGNTFYNTINLIFEIKEQQQILVSVPQYVENELIIQFEEEVDAAEFATNSNLGITPKELLSRRLNIWLFETDGTKALSVLIDILSQNANVKIVQYNHTGITPRGREDRSFQENILNTVKFNTSNNELTFMNSQNNPVIVFIKD